MSIIFKILKYLKNYSNLIKNVLIIALALRTHKSRSLKVV